MLFLNKPARIAFLLMLVWKNPYLSVAVQGVVMDILHKRLNYPLLLVKSNHVRFPFIFSAFAEEIRKNRFLWKTYTDNNNGHIRSTPRTTFEKGGSPFFGAYLWHVLMVSKYERRGRNLLQSTQNHRKHWSNLKEIQISLLISYL